MASRALDRTLADFIASALSPPLIMGMVGSLVFFLQEILYEGLYSGTLRWTLFFFVFGAVLIARISMQGEIASRASMYGLVLGGLVWIALQQYVDYSDNPALAGRSGLINLGLIALIWWSAHRLTLDCTYLEDKSTGPATGVLAVAGVKAAPASSAPIADEAGSPGKKSKKKKKKTAEERPGLAGWWARFLRHREQRKQKPKTHGVWVVYFSLAALPLFGLGQAQIPADDLARRGHAFFLLLIYIGSGLGLLLTTSFLGLRMYLRERQVAMPGGIAVGWLILGVLLIVGHLFVSSLLPRPADPQPLWDWTGLTRQHVKEPSPFSPMKEKGQKKIGEGKDGQPDNRAEDGQAQHRDGEQAGDGGQKSGAKGSGKDGKGSDGQKKDGEKADDARQGGKDGAGKPAEGQGGNVPEVPLPALAPLLVVARWIVIILVVLIVLFILARAALHFLANFTFWAQRLLALFDNFWQKFAAGQKGSEKAEEKKAATPRPFSTFSSPFDTGKAKFMSPGELVRYSFAALQAWGREHDLARADGETAFEFAERVELHFPNLGEEARKLAGLYAKLAYSTETLADLKADRLRHFWEALTNSAAGRRLVV